MKPHRQIRTSKRVGEPSSKYGYEPWKFDEDVRNKKEVQQKFKKDLEKVLYGDYRYNDGLMSYETKRKILLEVYEEFRKIIFD